MNTGKIKEIVIRMLIIAPALTPDNTADIERLKELATALFAELDNNNE